MTTLIIILSVVIALLGIALIFSLTRVITISDNAPKGNRPVDKALKLANEIAPYIKEKDGKITLKIVK